MPRKNPDAPKKRIPTKKLYQVGGTSPTIEVPATASLDALPATTQPTLPNLPPAQANRTLPVGGAIGASLLARMHGRSTPAGYVVAAVKGETGIIAVREVAPETIKIKFYPSLEYWEITPRQLGTFGAFNGMIIRRDTNYVRYYCSKDTLNTLLNYLQAKVHESNRMPKRFLATTVRVLMTKFGEMVAEHPHYDDIGEGEDE